MTMSSYRSEMPRDTLDLDLAGWFAFMLASGVTLGDVFAMRTYFETYPYVFVPLAVAANVGAWTGWAAWRRRRWIPAAIGFFVALGWPAGFELLLTGPLTFGLFVVSLLRAWGDRRIKRHRDSVSVP